MLLPEIVDLFKANASASAFILDFDGCLSAIAVEPSAATVVEGGREVLSLLAESYSVVAIVTGRRAEDVHSRLLVPGIRYIGLYGGEELSDDHLIQDPDAERWRGMASRTARDAQAMIFAEGLAGCQVEYKDLAVSIHLRNAIDPDAEAKVMAWALGAASKRELVAVLGRKVVELRPAGMTKASVVDRFVSSGEIRFLLITGDDSSDVEAMRRSGDGRDVTSLRIGVRSEEEPPGLAEVADLLVDDPAGVVALLRLFVH